MRFNDGYASGKPNPLKPRVIPADSPLAESAFAPNPGNLRMFSFVPVAPRRQALVVVLHGCGQSATGYDQGTGWSQLAAEQGFAVLAVEQKAVNNPATCFNWFDPQDISRGEGEVASIAAMIAHMIATHGLDPAQVFITGLSAGGAMTAAMLATYPELFAGGAIIAGLPFGAAANVRDALEAMRAAPAKSPRAWGDAVRAASSHAGEWPRLSIWHGDADATVTIGNAKASTAQWADLHGLKLSDAKEQTVEGAVRLAWGDRLEVYTVPGLGHGTPIDAADVGSPAPYILDAGISSTRRIAHFWGLVEAASVRPATVTPRAQTAAPRSMSTPSRKLAPKAKRIEKVILGALKAAGLIRRR